MSSIPFDEDLRKWFGKGKEGGIGGGGWDRYNTKGERIGKCGDAEDRGGEGEGKPKCLSKEKAAQLRAQGGKKAIANAVKRKKAQDPVTDRKGTGGAPRPVSNRIGEAMLSEKNVPTNPSLWSRAKAEAKKRFDVYPSAYANGWAAKWYKERGGEWKTEKNEAYDLTDPSQREWGTSSLTNIYKSMTPGEMDEAWQKITTCQQCKSKLSPKELKMGSRVCEKCVKKNKGRVWGHDKDDSYMDENTVLDKPTMTVDAIAKKHNISVRDVEVQLQKGIRIEREHTTDDKVAREIALDHLGELPDYYDRLAKIEKTDSHQLVQEFVQSKNVVLLAVPKNPAEGDGKGYWKVGSEVFRGPVKNVKFDASGAPMDKRWESSFTHFARYFDGVYGQYYKKAPTWTSGLKEDVMDLVDIIFEAIDNDNTLLQEATEYQGRKVTLNKPFRTPDGPKKFSVYVKNDKGNVVKVNFGDPKLSIKRDDPERRKNFRARHGCDNPGPRWKAKYWSCKFWSKKSVTDLIKETPSK